MGSRHFIFETAQPGEAPQTKKIQRKFRKIKIIIKTSQMNQK
jgi:hypothetical protein